MERMTGVEPASKAWEAFVLPMNYIRKMCLLGTKKKSITSEGGNIHASRYADWYADYPHICGYLQTRDYP